MHQSADRVVAVDVYRGIVMLLLLPDQEGAFSFYRMAERFPDSAALGTLAGMFSHVAWSGFSAWDLIQPSFMFLVGVAMALSTAKRRARGDTEAELLAHVLLRSAVLFLLVLVLAVPFRTLFQELAPLLLVAAGLPLPARLMHALGAESRHAQRRLELLWSAAIVVFAAVWVSIHVHDLGNYVFNTILSQLGLASPLAFLLVGKPARVQLGAALALLAGHWLLFALYPTPGPGFDPASVGVLPGEEWHTGLFAHWNKNANAGAAFDVWFLNLLPRAEPFVYSPFGLTTLNFVPSTATMLFGVMSGELLLRRGSGSGSGNEIRNKLLAGAALAAVAGLAAAAWLCPLVKSLWTPSWTLFTGGVCALFLAALYHFCDVRGPRAWAAPLAILGTNSILLYTLSLSYRWWFLAVPRKLGIDLSVGPYGPLQESVAFLAMLGAIAFVLYRLKVFVRL